MLTYDAGQYAIDGAPVSGPELVAFRDQQIELWAAELGRLTIEELGITITRTIEDAAGQITAFRPLSTVAIEFPLGRIERFAARFLARVGEFVTSAYVFAAGGVEAVTEQGWRTVAGMVARQETFGRGFVEALRSGELSEAQAVARARLYAGAAVESFERGRGDQLGLELPGYPGDGQTPCLGQCRCVWLIEELPDRWRCTWDARDDDGTCTGCKTRAEVWSPWEQRR